MKLKTLRVNHFVGVEEAEIGFDKPVTLFAGRNNQGKSTVKDAIEFSLTGMCRAMKFKKDKTYLHRGDNGMATELLYENHEGVEVITNGSRRNGDNLDVLHYCLNPAEFISLPAKERAKILAAVLGGGLDDVVKSAIAEHIGNIDETVLAEVKGSGINILDVDAFKKEIVEIRRSYKRLIADLPKKPPLLGDYELEDGYDVTKDREAVKALAERIKNGTDMLADAKAMLQAKAEIADLQKALKHIASDKKTVPSLPRGVSKKKLEDAPSIMLFMEDMLKGSGVNCECPVCAQKTERGKLKAHYDDVVTWYEKYKNVVRKRTEAELHNQRTDTEKQIKETQLKEAKAKLKNKKIPKGGEALLAQLQTERDQAQERIANFRRFEIDTEAFETAGQKREGLKGLVAECDRIDEALKDGGPVKSAIAAGGKTLPINESLLTLWSMSELSWSDNGEIKLGDLPIEYASASEQYRAGCVMGMALAEVSGIGVVALDGYEILDPDNASAFVAACAKTRINNALIFCSSDKNYTDVQTPEFLGVFQVSQGNVTRIH